MKRVFPVSLLIVACVLSKNSEARATDYSCERLVQSYVNELFITKKRIRDCAPPVTNCFHRFELEETKLNGEQTFFASYDRNEGYSTSEIFRVTVNTACEIIDVSDDSN